MPRYVKDNLELQQKALESRTYEELIFLAGKTAYDEEYCNRDKSEPDKKDLVYKTGNILMLGMDSDPQLLVKIISITDLNQFRFFVINGAWEGNYDNGTVIVEYTKTTTTGWEILSDDQTLFNGGDYNVAFKRYHKSQSKQKALDAISKP